jgi:calcium-dependent protein kinase
MGARQSCFGTQEERIEQFVQVIKPPSQGESTYSLTDLPLRYITAITVSNITEESRCGKGTYGFVFTATEKSDVDRGVSRKVATKRTNKEKDSEALRNERNILSNLDHAHIIKLYGITTSSIPCQVMEICDFELFTLISANGPLPEQIAQDYFRQIMMALNHLHSVMHIVHRDIKPENVLLNSAKTVVKLCDFGTAVRLGTGRGTRANGRTGSLSYAAPEVYVSSVSDYASDIWSAGVLLYVMKCAASPFRDPDDANPEKAAVDRVKRAKFNTSRPRWKEMPTGPKRMIVKLLQVEGSQRPTAADVLRDPWLTKHVERETLVAISKRAAKCLEKYTNIQDPEIKACWLGLASQMGDWDIVREAFEIVDADLDGVLGFEDLTLLGFSQTMSKFTFSYTEFIAANLLDLDPESRNSLLGSVAPFAFKAIESDLQTISDYTSYRRLVLADPRLST